MGGSVIFHVCYLVTSLLEWKILLFISLFVVRMTAHLLLPLCTIIIIIIFDEPRYSC